MDSPLAQEIRQGCDAKWARAIALDGWGSVEQVRLSTWQLLGYLPYVFQSAHVPTGNVRGICIPSQFYQTEVDPKIRTGG